MEHKGLDRGDTLDRGVSYFNQSIVVDGCFCHIHCKTMSIFEKPFFKVISRLSTHFEPEPLVRTKLVGAYFTHIASRLSNLMNHNMKQIVATLASPLNNIAHFHF